MANELAMPWITSKTLYFLLRSATNQIWNGSSFENYATANLGNYDIPATEQGTASAYYVANMPGASAGVYTWVAKEQAGGSPAEGDILVGTGYLEWSGSAVLPLSNLGSIILTSANLNSIADTILSRDVDNVEASAAVHSLCSAILKMVSKFMLDGAEAKTYRTNGSDVHMTQVRTTDSSLVATKTLGVAG